MSIDDSLQWEFSHMKICTSKRDKKLNICYCGITPLYQKLYAYHIELYKIIWKHDAHLENIILVVALLAFEKNVA